MGLLENLYSISSIKSDIKSALEAKGVDMTNYSFPDYPSVISSLSTGGNYGQIGIVDNGTYYPSVYGVDAFDEVVVSVPSPQFVTETLSVSVNGTYTPGQGVDGYSQVVVDVPQSVTGIDEKEVTEQNVHIINLNNSASFVADGVFRRNTTLQTVYLPNCIYVGTEAFSYCTSLTQVDLPICTSILGAAFYHCSSLISVYLPECTYIYRSAFGYCSSLQSMYCKKMVSIYRAAFYQCSSLQSIDLPECIFLDSEVFRYCTSLSWISIPNVSNISFLTFGKCDKLSSIELPQCRIISSQAFGECGTLSTVVLGYSSVCQLLNSNAFYSTPIESGTGSIYVPTSLVDEYKSATNWSVFSSQIFPIPE